MVPIDANIYLTYDFFVGSATEFLSGPIYDLNQIGQVVAGTYNKLFFNQIIMEKHLKNKNLYDVYNINCDYLLKSIQLK